ncbi:MAG: hypothetical protein K2O45_00155 [Oscillospiraceae bacterium]|nr:hypothetical protein [Oscillospiraceae bacterium]
MANTTHFFLGANSGQGFQNLFQRFCAPEDHFDLLILKGGPGAGKSTMMRTIGQAMEEKGEQVEYLYCSGDPGSLDGVHIPRIRTAIVDGTAPHVIEPKYPAAADRYVNLGQFYDIAAAKAARSDIIRCSQAGAAAYQRAYRALGAARQMADSAAALVAEGLDTEKLLRRTDGIIGRELRGKGPGGRDEYRFLGSLTCRGPVWRFDSVQTLCSKVYQLQDAYGLAAPMLQRLHAAASVRGFRAIVCPDPEHTDRVQHLLLPELDLAFVTSREGMEYTGPAYRRVRLDAMVNAAHYKRFKARLRFSARVANALREEGLDALREAKAAHDQLEAAYHPHVDFDGVNRLVNEELTRIESYL